MSRIEPPARARASGLASMSKHLAGSMRVLIVEDVFSVAALMEASLRAEGMEVLVASSGADAVQRKIRFRPDVVLVDLGLPDVDGLDLVRRFALDGDCGVIVVTANDAEVVRVAGLETGADDYIVKPAALRELAARIRAVHRRVNRPDAPVGPYRGPKILVDPSHRCLSGPDHAVTPLTEAEFAAMESLLEADGVPVSREWLGRVALKRTIAEDDRSVDQLVLKLRRKLGNHGVTSRAILSTRGLGYVIPEPGRFILGGTSLPPR